MYSTNGMLDDLLQRICTKLQIRDSQRNQAETHYNAVGEWLAKDENLYSGADLQIYAQGSLRIGTTVRPKTGQEFDLDLVCEFDAKWRGNNPLELLLAVERRLKEHGTYQSMVEMKKRCVRLNYANEFHMDILPAVPANSNNDGCLKVPDRKVKSWKDSNPKGYSEWFEDQTKTQPVIKAFEDRRTEIEPFPEDEEIDFKPPLKRAVQLIKRYRDEYFKDSPDMAPISIVLTTLAGHHYNGETSVNVAVSTILRGILSSLPNDGVSRLVVLNPSNEHEDLSERWDEDPKHYSAFVTFIQDFADEWGLINESRGLPNIAVKLQSMFGESITKDALYEQTMFIEKLRKAGNLEVLSTGGALTMASTSIGAKTVSVKGNTFFGEE